MITTFYPPYSFGGDAVYVQQLSNELAKRSRRVEITESGGKLCSRYENVVAVIVPSLWHEVFRLIILEAFSQATSAIVKNRGAMPKIIEESGAVFLFDTDTKLVNAIDRLISDENLRGKMGQCGYKALPQKGCAEVRIKHYLELVEQIATQEKQCSWGVHGA